MSLNSVYVLNHTNHDSFCDMRNDITNLKTEKAAIHATARLHFFEVVIKDQCQYSKRRHIITYRRRKINVNGLSVALKFDNRIGIRATGPTVNLTIWAHSTLRRWFETMKDIIVRSLIGHCSSHQAFVNEFAMDIDRGKGSTFMWEAWLLILFFSTTIYIPKHSVVRGTVILCLPVFYLFTSNLFRYLKIITHYIHILRISLRFHLIIVVFLKAAVVSGVC